MVFIVIKWIAVPQAVRNDEIECKNGKKLGAIIQFWIAAVLRVLQWHNYYLSAWMIFIQFPSLRHCEQSEAIQKNTCPFR
jgi:hypothetical protein